MVYGNNIFLFDEPENDLHYDLFLFYLNAFLYNSDKSQMIIASHLTSLLAEDLINEQRDLIYFVEKDFETATSSCKRADKYGLHKNQSLYNAYKIGKLGAKPALGSPFILNE
jgi:predicted ATP-dependent endonuclease of OLD family